MTFLNDIWKKFKSEPTQEQSRETSDIVTLENPPKTDKEIKKTKENLKQTKENYLEVEKENLQKDKMMDNLKALKEALDHPKEEVPELRFTQVVKKHLDEPAAHETVRQERWPENIRCPKCNSNHLKRVAQIPPASSSNHRYRCLDCDEVFSDETGTPFEQGVPPLNVWMQCWYLMGCTDSLNYIAVKLNLDLATVKIMVGQLQKIFNAQKPLTHFLKYEEWNKQADQMRKQLKDDLLKQYEQLDANVSTAPKDTTEFRRQQTLRRTGGPSIEPSTTSPKKKF